MQNEAAALLSRSAIEACVTGVFCQLVDDGIARLKNDNARSAVNMMLYLRETGAFSNELIDATKLAFGEQRRLTMPEMLQSIDEANGPSGPKQLEQRVYRGVSSYFGHGTGLALLRHVDRKDRLRRRASFPWVARSPVHTSDACVGLLAAVIAGPGHPDYETLNAYADGHWSRVAPVFVAVGGKGVIRQLQPSKVNAARRAFVDMIDYLDSSSVWMDSPETKRQRVREGFYGMLGILGQDHDEGIVDALVDMVVDTFTDDANE